MERILMEDFEQIYNQKLSWNQMKNKCVLVTGATGLIGSLLVRYMDYMNKIHGLNIRLVAIVHNAEKAYKMFPDMGIQFYETDIVEAFTLDISVDYMFHCAAITQSKQMVECPVEVFETIVMGTSNMLRFVKEHDVKSMVYVSSMEMYGQVSSRQERITEKEMGSVYLLQSRSCYPLGKQAAEQLCYDYYSEYGIPVKIARLAQTFGAGVLPGEGRVFAQFARSAREGKDIVLHTDGSSMGNYCYTADAISGLFTLLLKGVDGEAYNIANERATMTILQMAQLVAEKIAQGTIKVVLDIPKENSYGYAAPTKLRLSTDKLQGLGWKATRELEEMYSRMLEGKYI